MFLKVLCHKIKGNVTLNYEIKFSKELFTSDENSNNILFTFYTFKTNIFNFTQAIYRKQKPVFYKILKMLRFDLIFKFEVKAIFS